MTDKENPKLRDDLGELIQTEELPESAEDQATSARDFALADLIDIQDAQADERDDDAFGREVAYPVLDNLEEEWFEDVASNNGLSEADLDADLVTAVDAGDLADTEIETLNIDGAWFIDEAEDATVEDGGAEGPALKEKFDFDENAWDSIDEDEDDVEEDIYETMKRMDLSLPELDEAPLESEELPTIDAVVAFLGPEHNRMTDAIFINGRPIGVGDHLFVPGADGQFHATIETLPLELNGTDLVWHDNVLFIGTQKRGGLVTSDIGRTLKSINSWYTSGFLRKGDVTVDECSTSFSLRGHHHPTHFRLFGLTGEGQLFVSEDLGISWHGPLLRGCCSRLASASGDETVWALTQSAEDMVTLNRSDDLHTWHTVPLPAPLHRCLSTSNAVVVVNRDTLVVFAKNASCPPFRSKDKGQTWQAISGFSRIAALVLSPDADEFIATAAFSADGNAQIAVSFDGGKTRYLAAIISTGDGQRRSTVGTLSLRIENSRRLMAVTEGGAYLITLPTEQVKH